MDRQKNMLIGIVVGIVIVGASIFATGYTRRLLSPFRMLTTYESSELATAPELASGDWINSEPLKLKDLRGRVVLIDFWTFGCINCRNTLPFIKAWHDRYRDQGLTVVGVLNEMKIRERRVAGDGNQKVGERRSRAGNPPANYFNRHRECRAYNVSVTGRLIRDCELVKYI